MFFVISLLRKRCFPECSSFASTRNICHANMTLNFFRNILFPQQMLLAGANDETIYVMFPQKCFFVYGGLYLNLYYPGYHKYDEQLLDALSHPITVHHHKNVIQYSHLTNSECTEYVTIAVNRNLSNCEKARKKGFRGFNGLRTPWPLP